MNRRARLIFCTASITSLAALGAVAASVPGGVPRSVPQGVAGTGHAAAQSSYLLACGGCHGLDGVSNSKLVPELRAQVGYFLRTEGGREYLVRVPNVAFSTASNEELAGLLNYMLFELGGASVPEGTKPYTTAEVARLRKRPLTEVSLTGYRERLVETLILNHDAPASLRVYGSDGYGISR